MKSAAALLTAAHDIAGRNGKTWLTLDDLRAALDALPEVHAPVPAQPADPDPAPSLGSDAEDLVRIKAVARRLAQTLHTIRHSYGSSIDAEWMRRQAALGLGYFPTGWQAWQFEFPVGGENWYFVVPDPDQNLPVRLTKSLPVEPLAADAGPLATLRTGEAVTVTLSPVDRGALEAG